MDRFQFSGHMDGPSKTKWLQNQTKSHEFGKVTSGVGDRNGKETR